MLLAGLWLPELALRSAPFILTQPQNQTVPAGTTVNFSVTAADQASLPAVSSGTLQLWLRADAGVITNAAGQVSQWQDQSGHNHNAAQTNAIQQPTLVSAPGLSNAPVVRFNGKQDNVSGSFLKGAGIVDVPNAMTAFTVYNAFSIANYQNLLWGIGLPGTTGALRGPMIGSTDLHFTFWVDDYCTSFVIPVNTYRIRADVLNTNLDTLQMYDVTPTNATDYPFAVSGVTSLGDGVYVGGLDPTVPNVGTGLNFDGDIAEVVCYAGYLSDTDRLAVTSYLLEKYFQGPNPVKTNFSYQWLFDGAAVANATNATLNLNNVLVAEAGSYQVVITDNHGSVTSAVAVLTVTLTTPRIVAGGASFGFQTNHFGFNIAGVAGQTVCVDVSTNLTNWTSLFTNTLNTTPIYFFDPTSTNSQRRFYRARYQ